MKKLTWLNVLAIFFIVSAAPLFLTAPAQAYVYDDFSSVGIDTELWTVSDSQGLFSQPGDGYLYFSDPGGGKKARLSSANAVNGAFFVCMQFSAFAAVNQKPPGQFNPLYSRGG